MIFIVKCPSCDAKQFTIPARIAHAAKSANDLMLLMTEGKSRGEVDCQGWKEWGKCKRASCGGVWWRSGWINTERLSQKKPPLKDATKTCKI